MLNKILIGLVLIGALASCSTLDESVGISETDNAMQCVEASASSSNPFVPGTITTKRVELPANYDTSTLTLDAIQGLMDWCD